MKDLWRRISAGNESSYGCRDEKLGDANLWSRLQILKWESASLHYSVKNY